MDILPICLACLVPQEAGRRHGFSGSGIIDGVNQHVGAKS